METRLDIKEAAVRERRVWVRLTRRCNNGCLFCLDADSLDGSAVPSEEVERLIRQGRADGGQRLILSGGEPTLHPDYLKFLALGKDLGYTWRQTVSNGRMFAYRKFADAAVEAGLCEATFSMHAHREDLFDRLVGVPGAFRQALAGLKNLVGRIVVNVDVVLSRMNLPFLREILDFYIGLGIHEFDLLHMVPFGRAWNENRELLFYDPAEMAPHFRRAFEVRKNRGVILWTNRLPARFLEGNEDLIQDPHKLHDEVRGRMAMFEAWRDRGELPICMGDRCPHCPMEGFCKALQESLTMSPPAPPQSRVSGGSAPDCLPAEKGVDLLLREMSSAEASQVTLVLPARDYLSEADEKDLDLPTLQELARVHGCRIAGIPPCLGGLAPGSGFVTDSCAAAIETLPFDAQGRLDLVAFTDWYIRNRCFVKSLRCSTCALDSTCRGLHITSARRFGLGVLAPVSTSSRD
jgi:MoaA/NifB/PqqE/SkfB family radical SAM enzyme